MASLGELTARMVLDTAQFTGALGKVEQQLAGVQKSIANIGRDVASNVAGMVGAFLGAQKAIEAFNNSVARASGLDDLSDATGIAVEDLDQISLAMKLAGVESSTFERALNELAKTMVEARDPTSKSAAIMKALGVETKNAKGEMLGMGEVFQSTLRQLAAIEDPALRAATAQAVLGKSGKELNKMLQDQEEVAQLAADQIAAYGVTTSGTAKNAESFQRSMILLEDAIQRAAQPVIDALAPAMRDIIGAFSAGDKEGLSFAKTLGTALATGLKLAADLAATVWGVFQKLGLIIGGVAAAIVAAFSGDFSGVKEVFKALDKDLETVDKNYEAFQKRLWNTEPHKAAAAAAKTNAVATGQLTTALNQHGDAAKKSADLEKARAKAAKETADLIAKLTKEANDEEDERLKLQQVGLQMSAKVLQDARDEAAALTETATQRALDNLERSRTIALNRQLEPFQRDLINRQYDEARALIVTTGARKDAIEAQRDYAEAMKKTAADQQAMIDDLTQTGADWIMTLVNEGTGGFKSLWDSFKNFALRAFAEVAAKSIVLSMVGGNVTGGAGGASGISSMISSLFGGGGGGGMGGLLGGIGSFSNPYGSGFSLSGNTWGGTASGMGPPTATGGLSQTYGDMASGAFGGATMGLGIGSLAGQFLGNERNQQSMQVGGMIGGAIGSIWGPLGAMAGSMIGSAIGSLIKSGGGPKTGGFGQTGKGGVERFFTPSDQDALAQSLAEGTEKGYTELVKAFGGKKGSLAFALGFDLDPKGTAGNRLTSGVFGAGGEQVYGVKDLGVGKTQEELEAAMALESKRMILAALQSSDLPESVSRILNTVLATSATTEQIDDLMAVTSAFADLNAVVEAMGDPLKAATEALDAAGRSALEQLTAQREALRELAATVPTTADGLAELNEATRAFYQSTVQLVGAILQTKEALDSMFGATRESIVNAALTPEQRYAREQERAQNLFGQLGTATDPEAIARIAEQLNASINAAFGMLSPEEQAAMSAEFLEGLDEVQALAQARLDAALADVQTHAEEDQAYMSGVLNSILDGIERSSTTFATAADVIAAAAANGINVTVTVDTEADVAVTGG